MLWKKFKNNKKCPINWKDASKEKINSILSNLNLFVWGWGKIILYKEYLEHITICWFKKFQCKFKHCKFIRGFEECLKYCNKNYFAYLMDKHLMKCDYTKCKYWIFKLKK